MAKGKRTASPERRRTRICLVCATRTGRSEFPKTYLGKSLALWEDDRREIDPFHRIEVIKQIYYENTRGLPDVYNVAINELSDPSSIFMFVHDDVYLCDFNWPGIIMQGLEWFDAVGLAGTARIFPGQEAWHLNEHGRIDTPEFLSGTVGHGDPTEAHFVRYGYAPRSCQLLDGLLLAVRSDTLDRHDLRFDRQYLFHCYDMDFCRQAVQKGLQPGTIRLSVIHGSGGYGVNSPGFDDALMKYLGKWADS